MNRRGFLGSILAAGVAPYVLSNGIASGILMPVRKLSTPPFSLGSDDFTIVGRTSPNRGSGVLRLYTGTPETGGTLLATIDYPDADFSRAASGTVIASGEYTFARIDHPQFGNRPIDLTLPNW